MAIAPWGPLGQGKFKTKEARGQDHDGSARASELSESDIKISDALEDVAKKHNATLHGVVSLFLSSPSYRFPVTNATLGTRLRHA